MRASLTAAITAIIAALLTAPSIGASDSTAKNYPTADLIAGGKQAVRDLLRDPESAIFEDVRQVGYTTCGTVNARNAYGGYVGRKPFAANGGGPFSSYSVIIYEPHEIDQWRATCDADAYQSDLRRLAEASLAPGEQLTGVRFGQHEGKWGTVCGQVSGRNVVYASRRGLYREATHPNEYRDWSRACAGVE